MNNLKRVLSLGLAGTMLAGMMMVGASAVDAKDFADVDEIKNQEAVTTMVALGVIAGKDTGSFDPAGTVTRAEMAKMITIMLNGGKEPVLNVKAQPTYSDIDGHWAEKYIEYCSGNNSSGSQIIAGQGDGTFVPDAPVTGSAAAKMALVALGYDSAVFGFTGIDWEVNVNGIANAPDADLYDGLETLDPTQGLSRDNAAQLLYNALDAKVMNRTYDKVQSNGEISYSYALGTKTMMENKFGAVKVEAIVTGNEFANLGATGTDNKGTAQDEGKTRVTVTNGEDQEEYKDNASYVFSIATGENELGKSVSFYVKPASTSQKSTVLGSVIVSEDNVVVTDASDDSIADVADDNNLDVAKNIPVYVNYGDEITLDDTAVAGVQKVLIDNDNDGDVDCVMLNTYNFGLVNKYSTSDDGSITISAGGVKPAFTADDSDDVVGFEDVAKDDYVTAAWIGGKLHVAKAEAVTGTLEALKTGETLTVDGTKYDVSAVAGFVKGNDNIVAANSLTNTSLDNDATFYLDRNGMIVAVGDVSENAYNYAYLWAYDAGGALDDSRAKVTLSNGTTKTYVVDSKGLDLGNEDIEADDKGEQRLYAYSINSDGELKLKATTPNATTEFSFSKGSTKVADGLYTTGSTVFFYVSMKDSKIDDVDVYTGYKNAPSLKADDTAGSAVTNTSDRVVAVAFEAADLTSTNVDDHMYITSIVSESTDYTTVKAILAGRDAEETIKVDSDDLDGKGLYLFTANSDDVYGLEQLTSSNDANGKYIVVGKIANYVSNSTLAVDEGEFTVTDDTVLVNLTDKGGLDTAATGALPADDDHIVAILVDGTDDGDKLLMVITKDSEKSGGSEEDPGTYPTAAVVDNIAGTVTVKHSGTKVAASALTSLIKGSDSNIKSIDYSGYTAEGVSGTLAITTVEDDTYTLAVVNEEYVLLTLTDVTAKIGKDSVKSNTFVKVGDELTLTSVEKTKDLQIKVNGTFVGSKATGDAAATHSYTAVSDTPIVVIVEVNP